MGTEELSQCLPNTCHGEVFRWKIRRKTSWRQISCNITAGGEDKSSGECKYAKNG